MESASPFHHTSAYWKRRLSAALADLLVWLVLLAMILPAVWVVFTSIRNPVEVNAKPPIWIPRELTLEGFKPLFGQATTATGSVPFDKYLRNSLFIAVSSTLLALAVGTMAGYTFARFNFADAIHSFWV